MLDDVELALLPAKLRESVLALASRVQSAEERAQRAELRLKLVEEMLRRERMEKYGPSSERLSDGQLALLEEEPGVHPREVQLEAELPEQQKQLAPRAKRGQRGLQTLPPHLPREEVLIACPPEQRICPCCQGERTVFDYDCTERLHRVPARHVVRVFKREKRACPRCEEGGVATAPAPAFIISKGIATNELVVDTVLAKYELHQPLYRQEAQLARDGEPVINRSTMCDWVMECGFLLGAVCQEMRQELLAGGYLQADETAIGVQSDSVRGRNHRGYLWQYSHPAGTVLFDYQDGRGRDGPVAMLHGFRGVLQTDGYAVYDQLKGPGVVHAGCMAHVRRKFEEVSKVDPADAALVQILGVVGALYRIEEQARTEQLTPGQRLELRQAESRPIMERLKPMIIALRQQVLPKGLVGKACDYALSMWIKLEVYLERGEVEIDNNPAERSIRPVALGRKNWLHFGSKAAGPRIAAILSVIETCHRLKVPARDYLLEVLPRLATGNRSGVAELTPQSWAAARRSVNSG